MARFPTKEEALAHFEVTNAVWIKAARAIAKWIGCTRGVCTSEDIWAVWPVPEGVDGRVMGCVFKEGTDWTQQDLKPVPSKRRCRHRGPVQVWRYIGPPVEPPEGLEALLERLEGERAEAAVRDAEARERRRARLEARA